VQEIANSTAFVTGAGSGIGLGIARALLAAGARVALADVRPSYLAEARTIIGESGGRALLLEVDVRDREQLREAADRTERELGAVRILCNNAGVSTGTPIEDATYADWDFLLPINVGGVVNGIVTFLPRMKAHGQPAHIVNTASMAALLPFPGAAGVYTATKYAVRGLSDSLRLSVGKYGIGVSVLCPHLVRSRLGHSEELRDDRYPSDPRPGRPGPGGGMDPLEVGKLVLAGIRANQPYILTHSLGQDEFREITEQILKLFPTPEHDDAGAVAFEKVRRQMVLDGRAAQL
jgi:NAD(P)-dependent dehydrogenase (short-subunit alcohol dehydrogenase family)